MRSDAGQQVGHERLEQVVGERHDERADAVPYALVHRRAVPRLELREADPQEERPRRLRRALARAVSSEGNAVEEGAELRENVREDLDALHLRPRIGVLRYPKVEQRRRLRAHDGAERVRRILHDRLDADGVDVPQLCAPIKELRAQRFANVRHLLGVRPVHQHRERAHCDGLHVVVAVDREPLQERRADRALRLLVHIAVALQHILQVGDRHVPLVAVVLRRILQQLGDATSRAHPFAWR